MPSSCRASAWLCARCLALRGVSAGLPGNCTAEEQQQFCNPGPKLSAECSVALTDAFGPKHQGDPGHNPLDMYQGFSSWSMHLNEPGHYYQCNGLDGFHYWVDYMYQFTNPPWCVL
jgi:hypothetical protein